MYFDMSLEDGTQIYRDSMAYFIKAMVERSFKNYQVETTSISELNKDEADLITKFNSKIRSDSYAIEVIVFSTFLIEIGIYEIAMEYMEKDFYDTYVDRMRLNKKFVMTYYLASGILIDTSRNEYGTINKLIKDRNSLVHFKARIISSADYELENEFYDEVNKHTQNKINYDDAVRNALKALKNFQILVDMLPKNNKKKTQKEFMFWNSDLSIR